LVVGGTKRHVGSSLYSLASRKLKATDQIVGHSRNTVTFNHVSKAWHTNPEQNRQHGDRDHELNKREARMLVHEQSVPEKISK
jgi:hypothetical protein